VRAWSSAVNSPIIACVLPRQADNTQDDDGTSGVLDHATMADDSDTTLQQQPWSVKLRSKAGWSDAASYTMSDLTMLRRELVIGYLVAGFLAVLVPMHLWNDMFIPGHGMWTSLENA